MTTPTPPNPQHDPKPAPKDPRVSKGPNNPLPGEPGGPSASGHIEGEEHDKRPDPPANPAPKR